MVVVDCLAAVDVVETDEGNAERAVKTLLCEPGNLPPKPGLLLAVVFNNINLSTNQNERKVPPLQTYFYRAPAAEKSAKSGATLWIHRERLPWVL